MKILVTLSARFDRGLDGRIYPQNPALTHHFFSRYLDVFEEVLVLARVRKLEGPPACGVASDGPGVSFNDVPMFSGVLELAKSLPQILTIVRNAIPTCQAYFLRVPDFLGTIIWWEVRRRGLPFAVEVVGNPEEGFKALGIRHPLLPLIRYLSIRLLRAQCSGASAAAYVNKNILPKLYPPGKDAVSTYYSSIDLPSSFLVKGPREYGQTASKLVFVGTLAVSYKGQDVLVESLGMLAARGLPCHLTILGEGRLRPVLAAKIKAMGLEPRVTFLGQVPSLTGVGAALDDAHLFVLPSFTEGMPKALIEAMARGLPCIGTSVGGFLELLPPEDLVPPGDPLALADKIMEVALDPERLTRMSARNLSVAQEYQDEVLRARRNEFYLRVRRLSASPGEV